MIRLPRFVAVALLSLLVLGMQEEAHRHALEHVRPLLTRAHDVGAAAPVDDVACAECALLAGGADAAAACAAPTSTRASSAEPPVLALASRPVPAPSFFDSRAPPAFL